MNNELKVFIHGYSKENNYSYCIYFVNENIKYISKKIVNKELSRRDVCIIALEKFFEKIDEYIKYGRIKCYINSNYCINILKNNKDDNKILKEIKIKYNKNKGKIELIYTDIKNRKNKFINQNYNLCKNLALLHFKDSELKIDFNNADIDNKTIVKIKEKKVRKKKIKINTN
jgi:hypothetical protein